MTWALVQAGNRASKTRHYLQWWESKPEQDAVTSMLQNLHDCTFLLLQESHDCTFLASAGLRTQYGRRSRFESVKYDYSSFNIVGVLR